MWTEPLQRAVHLQPVGPHAETMSAFQKTAGQLQRDQVNIFYSSLFYLRQ